MGLQVSEAIGVMNSDLNFNEAQLLFAGRELPIYPESVLDLRKAVDLEEFRESRGKNRIRKKRAAGHEILRGKVSRRTLGEAVKLTFRPTISRAFKAALDRYESNGAEVPPHLSLKLTFKHVYMSGIFYRTYEEEREGVAPAFEAIVAQERRNAKESHFSRNYTERKLLNILISEMKQDYENWKKAFA